MESENQKIGLAKKICPTHADKADIYLFVSSYIYGSD